MTLTINLTPEQQARLEANAARHGVDLDTYALQRLVGDDGALRHDRGVQTLPDGTLPEGQTMYDRLKALGVIGAVEGKPRKDGRN